MRIIHRQNHGEHEYWQYFTKAYQSAHLFFFVSVTLTSCCCALKMHIKMVFPLVFNWKEVFGVKNGPMVKGWDQGSIPITGSHFRFRCGVPFILARSLRNGTKNTGGPLCVCTPHMQSKDPPLTLRKESPISAGMSVGRGLSTIGASTTCSLEKIILSALRTTRGFREFICLVLNQSLQCAYRCKIPLVKELWYGVIILYCYYGFPSNLPWKICYLCCGVFQLFSRRGMYYQ